MMSGDERKCIEDQSGRTLLEMLAVLGIIVILTAIGGWGVNVALNYYRAYRISSSAQDRTILVAQKTRSRKNTKSGYENIINGDVMGSYPIEYVPSFSSAEYSIHDSKAFQISAFNKNVCNYLINIGGLKQIKQQMKMPVIINGKDINDNPICSDNESLNNLVIPFSERSGNHGSTPDDDIPDDVSDTDCAVPGGTIGNGEYYGCGKCVNGGLEKTTHGITDSDCQVCDSDFTVTNLNKELGNCQICVNGRKETKTDCCVADSDCTGSCEKCSGNKCVSNIAYKSVKKHNSNGCCINQNIGWCQNDSAAEPTDDCSTDNINACQVCDSSGNVSSVSGCCLANSDCTGSCEICNTSTHRCVSNLGTKPAKRLNANGCCITQSVPWCPGSSLPADTCTTDNINACQTCDSSGNISAVPGCCLADSDCSGACTKCDSENHQCVSNIASKKVKKLNANGCCMEETVEWCRSSAAEPQDECTGSNINACQVCDATGNVLPVEGCCLSDADCTGGCEKCENNVCQSKQTDKVVWRTNDVGCCVEDTITWCPIDPNADEPVSNCAELNNQIDACHICKDGAVVQVGECPTTCGYALSSVQADCEYNFGAGYNAECGYNFTSGYKADCQYTYTSDGNGTVTVSGSGCSDSQYCAIFWNQASWEKDSVPTVQSSDMGTLYGQCQALSENTASAGASTTVITTVKGCPTDKYCAIFWNKDSWMAGSVPTVQSSDTGLLYGMCEALSEYVSTTPANGTSATAVHPCPDHQYCAVFWTAPTWTTSVPNVTSATTGTVYGKCQALSMNIPNTTVGAAVINTQKMCAEGEYCSISCSDKDCASNITTSATDNVYGRCVAP